MNRRDFLKNAGLACIAGAISGLDSWAMASAAAGPGSKKMIIVFLRGAVDGLSVVVPYGDNRYYSVRNGIAIPRPGEEGGAIKLDSEFGLHPSLAPLHPFWQKGNLAFVHASGSPDPSRSHFDAQDFMESGTPGVKMTGTGWMNRLLLQLPDNHSPVRAINVGQILPRIFQGPSNVASFAPAQQNGIKQKAIDNPVLAEYFESMYSSRGDALSKAFNEGVSAHRTIKKELQEEMVAANRGAPDANAYRGFGNQMGTLFAKDPTVQVGFIAIGGWDTHVGQGNSKGQLANKLGVLGRGLAELASKLGPELDNTIICVVSEFGRTVKENGNGGTDHGHGNVMMLLGGGVAGGKVHAKWSGLDNGQLYEGRDLPVTTDFRSVLTAILSEHMLISKAGLQNIFPGFQSKDNLQHLLKG